VPSSAAGIFCHDVRIVRLPRHNGSLPVASASPARPTAGQARITAEGTFLEALEDDPGRFLPEARIDIADAVAIDLDGRCRRSRAISASSRWELPSCSPAR
jgi:fumarate hydratase class I